MIGIGYAYLQQNRESDAQRIFTECLQLFARMGLAVGLGTAFLFEGSAILAARDQDAPRAIRLFAAADALWQPPNSPRRPQAQRQTDREIAPLCAQVDEETFARLYEEGLAMTHEQVVAYLLENAAA